MPWAYTKEYVHNKVWTLFELAHVKLEVSTINSQKQSSFYPEKFVFIVLVYPLHSTAPAKRKTPAFAM